MINVFLFPLPYGMQCKRRLTVPNNIVTIKPLLKSY